MHSAYYIVPLCIEQPTWGGTYIAKFKGITSPLLSHKKIGQSYELAQESLLTTTQTSNFGLTDNSLKSIHFDQKNEPLIKLADLIQEDPEHFLGQAVVKVYGAKMPLLIKFTQAQENSYQLHVKKGGEFESWQAKPESWYFFEEGKATLGLSPSGKIAEYKQRSQEIYDFSRKLSQEVTAGTKTVETAQAELKAEIDKKHPREFINTINIPKNSVVDISAGGIHHSWEAGPEIPEGNIVYEVQQDVKDDVSTLRSFDQGKMKENGEVRTLTIEEYFQAIDTTAAANNPANFVRPITEKKELLHIFDTEFYRLAEFNFQGKYQSDETEMREGFHHLFVKEGEVVVETSDRKYPLSKGWSLLVPAATQKYTLVSQKSATILKTTV
ncbi:MAG TPA: hypothetical protein VF209_04110 [Patescibacteria group bacterium]